VRRLEVSVTADSRIPGRNKSRVAGTGPQMGILFLIGDKHGDINV
jgi:hypothetical protein